jgi:hypothetical protein
MRFMADVTEEDIANLSHSRIILKREPENPHDYNAVKCLVGSKHIGYINKEAAEIASPLLAEGAVYKVTFEKRYEQSVAVSLKFNTKEKEKKSSPRRTVSETPPKQNPEPVAINRNAIAKPEPKTANSNPPLRRTSPSRTPAAVKTDDRCFIASYAFGIDDPRTDYFREFRDRHLQDCLTGRFLMASYYRLSPHLVRICKKNALVDLTVRSFLNRLLPVTYRNQ